MRSANRLHDEYHRRYSDHQRHEDIEQTLHTAGFSLFSLSRFHFGAAHQTARRMTTQYWLVKSEPDAYAWTDFVRDGTTAWTGVRNNAARLHLKAMRPGDRVLFYESMTTKAVVGTARVTRAAFPDTTAEEAGWVAVELEAGKALAQPVTLAAIKAEPALAKMTLLRISRLSVQPVLRPEFERIVKMGA